MVTFCNGDWSSDEDSRPSFTKGTDILYRSFRPKLSFPCHRDVRKFTFGPLFVTLVLRFRPVHFDPGPVDLERCVQPRGTVCCQKFLFIDSPCTETL